MGDTTIGRYVCKNENKNDSINRDVSKDNARVMCAHFAHSVAIR